MTPAPAPSAACDPIDRLRCGPCGPDERFWLSADYLLWAVQSNGVPPLVVGDLTGTPRSAVGLPGTLGQQTLFGGTDLNGNLRSGLRVTGGLWLDGQRRWGLEGDFFFLATGSDGGTFSSSGSPPLARPFFNVAAGMPDAELVALPGLLSGSVAVDARNTFNGGGLFLRRNLCCASDACDPCTVSGYRLDVLAGYRHFALDDTIQVREDLLTVAPTQVPPGTRLVVTDRFRTENTFDGALLGLAGDVRRGRWSADFRGGASFGNLHRALVIDGGTVIAVPGQPATARVGGLLAQPSNIGRYTSDAFTTVPEVGLNLGCQLTRGLRAHIGYTFIYLPNTWRAGDQIDRVVDPTQLAGAASPLGRPAATRASTGTAVQGVNFGLMLRY
jgi:hypothetical protein